MNDPILNELSVHVTQIVGRLPASASRRQQMHEELLAHLLDIYDEELHQLPDKQVAAERAKQRFGQADELRDQLATAVPWVERVLLFFLGKESIMWRWLWIVGVLAVMIGMGFVLPAVQLLRNPAPITPNDRFSISVLYPFGIVVTLLGLVLLAYSVIRGVHARRC